MKHFKCPECGLPAAEGFTDLAYEVNDTTVTLRNVSAMICANGHAYVDGYVAENANRLVDRVVEDLTSFSKKMPRTSSTPRQIMIAT